MASNAPVVSHGRGGERDQAGNAGKAMVDNLKALRILVQTLLSESANIPISTPSSFDTGCATRYVDGEITRQGAEGDQGDGAYSAGRGGAANIGSPRVKAQKGPPHDQDVVPEPAIRSSTPENFHTGRGGEGNVHKDKSAAPPHDGLADKLKHKIGLGQNKK